MAFPAPSERVPSPLDTVLAQAGAVFSDHGPRRVVIHYGSAAAELAVCVSTVGLVDRSELTKLVVDARRKQLDHLLAGFVGGSVSPGEALCAEGAWWGRAERGRLVVLCEPQIGNRLRARLQAQALRGVGVVVSDRSADWGAIGLLGRAAGKVMRALGVYRESGDARPGSLFTLGTVGVVEARWLLQYDRCAVALVPHELAGAAWRTIETVGRPFGISCVGREAAGRYGLLERAQRPEPVCA